MSVFWKYSSANSLVNHETANEAKQWPCQMKNDISKIIAIVQECLPYGILIREFGRYKIIVI